MRILKGPLEFQWDKGNIGKSFKKHKVKDKEAEEPFFDKRHKIFKDKLHSKGEERNRIAGKTKKGRLLFHLPHLLYLLPHPFFITSILRNADSGLLPSDAFKDFPSDFIKTVVIPSLSATVSTASLNRVSISKILWKSNILE